MANKSEYSSHSLFVVVHMLLTNLLLDIFLFVSLSMTMFRVREK